MSVASRGDLDRSSPPEEGRVRPFSFPEVSSSSLPNGLGLRVAGSGDRPLVSVCVVLDAGETLVADGSAGLAVLTGNALEGGTRNRSGPALAEALRLGEQEAARRGSNVWKRTA